MLKIKESHFLAIDFEYRQQGSSSAPNTEASESQVSEIGLASWRVGSQLKLEDYHCFAQGETLEGYGPEFFNHLQTHSTTTATVLVAHARGTEKKFLQKAYPHLSQLLWIDTLVLTRALYPSLSSYELGSVCQSLGLMPAIKKSAASLVQFDYKNKARKSAQHNKQWHSAGYDALACLELWKYLVEQAQWQEQDLFSLLAHFNLS